jgi:hypothetical protein
MPLFKIYVAYCNLVSPKHAFQNLDLGTLELACPNVGLFNKLAYVATPPVNGLHSLQYFLAELLEYCLSCWIC